MFSEIVDDILQQTRRLDQAVNIASYVNATLRECQVFKGRFFARDLVEDVINATSDPFIWTRPVRFRGLRAAKYVEENEFPDFIQPGKKQTDQWGKIKDHFFYAATDYFAFSGAGDTATINVAYYKYTRNFRYYVVADRPAVYDRETEIWSYHDDFDDSDVLKEQAEDVVSHWLMLDWLELIKEGARAKLWKNLSDENKGPKTFASYKSMQVDLLSGEAFTVLTSAQQAGGHF